MEIHVVPNEHEQWTVEQRKPSGTEIDSTWATQAEAEQRARSVLNAIGGGELTIHGTDGEPRHSVQVRTGGADG